MRHWRALSIAAIVFAALAMVTTGRLTAQEPAAATPDSPEAVAVNAQAGGETFHYFGFLTDPHYDRVERGALWIVLLVAVAGLGYAAMLVGQVVGADQGTEKMRTVARA